MTPIRRSKIVDVGASPKESSLSLASLPSRDPSLSWKRIFIHRSKRRAFQQANIVNRTIQRLVNCRSRSSPSLNVQVPGTQRQPSWEHPKVDLTCPCPSCPNRLRASRVIRERLGTGCVIQIMNELDDALGSEFCNVVSNKVEKVE